MRPSYGHIYDVNAHVFTMISSYDIEAAPRALRQGGLIYSHLHMYLYVISKEFWYARYATFVCASVRWKWNIILQADDRVYFIELNYFVWKFDINSQCTMANVNRKSQSRGRQAEGLDVRFAQARDRSFLLKIFLKFYPMDVCILRLKGDFGARSESHFKCYYHYYVMWCPFTTGIVALQRPS